MPETQAYRLRFNESAYITIDFSRRLILPIGEDGPTCGGVWCKALPPAEMDPREKAEFMRAEMAKPDPHRMHRSIVAAAVRQGATPEDLLSYAHVTGPTEGIQDPAAMPCGHMVIDGEVVPISSVFTPSPVAGPNATITRLPDTWSLVEGA